MDDPTRAAWAGAIANVLVASATLVLAVIAVFQERLRRRQYRPRVTVTRDEPLYTPWAAGGVIRGTVLFLRLRAVNEGNDPAREVEVSVTEVGERQAAGEYRRIRRGDYPKALVWSNTDRLTRLPFLHHGTEKLADVGHVHDPALRVHFDVSEEPPNAVLDGTAVLALEVAPQPLNCSHVFPSAAYRLHVVVSASNIEPVHVTVDVELTGTWSPTNAATVVSRYEVTSGKPTFAT
jgi:hypothetical protein